MKHESLRPYAESAEDLYQLLGRLQEVARRSLGGRVLALFGCLMLALLTTGAVAKTAIVLAVAAGLATLWSMFDYTCRDWAMHALTLHDVIRPRDPLLAAVETVLTETSEEAVLDGAGAGVTLPSD